MQQDIKIASRGYYPSRAISRIEKSILAILLSNPLRARTLFGVVNYATPAGLYHRVHTARSIRIRVFERRLETRRGRIDSPRYRAKCAARSNFSFRSSRESGESSKFETFSRATELFLKHDELYIRRDVFER